ncbi:hypothetical protein ACN2WE_31185 [Streptomyces sp. cg28]|uniref:hypothetical protein n=1 Tax=Streptomyces sp. cg28 TaxID=3403457 RepID=UPI003B2255E2
MSPHTHNRAQRNQLLQQLQADSRALLRDTSGRIVIDNAASTGQHAFQAILATFLMSTSSRPHVLEASNGMSMASTSAYVNTVISHPDRLDIHTNTASRVASRILPLVTDGHGLSGIPGLRLQCLNKRRLRLVHLPTGGRVDLIDAGASPTRRREDFMKHLRRETRWHHKPGTTPLWELSEVHPAEELLAQHWQARPCMLLRSALMARVLLLWGDQYIRPSWNENSLTGHPELSWDSAYDRPGAHVVGAALTQTPAAIPGARYEPVYVSRGLLSLASATIALHSH